MHSIRFTKHARERMLIRNYKIKGTKPFIEDISNNLSKICKVITKYNGTSNVIFGEIATYVVKRKNTLKVKKLQS